MTEFHDQLKDWFIEMGYPLDDAESTDWKTLVSGRLSTFWKDVINVLRSKHRISNLQKNMLLENIKEFQRRENTSAAKLGVILPPLQIYYPRQQEKLQKELDSLKLELSSDKHAYKLKMDERKRKCLELYETKQDIMEAERKIYLLNESSLKLTNDIDKYKNIAKPVEKYLGYFVSKNDIINSQYKNSDGVNKRLQDVLLHQNNTDEEKPHITCNESKISQTSPLVDLSDDCRSNKENSEQFNDSFIHKIPTSELLNEIVEYQKELPNILHKDILVLSEKNNECLKSSIKKGECTPLKESLSYIDLFHSQLVITTMKNKKECERVKKAINIIKPKIFDFLTGDDVKAEMFNQEISQIETTAYKTCLEEELINLKTGQGFYSKFVHIGIVGLMNGCQNINNIINNTNEKYVSLHSKIGEKSTAIMTQLERIKEENNKVKQYLLCIKRDSRADKVLWQSDYKDFQDMYLKIILKEPSVFKMETDNPFESFVYLKTIISKFNISERLMECHSSLQYEMKYLMNIVKNNSKLFLNSNSSEASSPALQLLLNWKKMEYLRPLHFIIYTIIKQIKFKNELESIDPLNFSNSNWPELVLGENLKADLKEIEEKSLLDAMEHLPKSSSSHINLTLDEFNETYGFVLKFIKRNENVYNTTPKNKIM